MQVAKTPNKGEKVTDADVLINCTFTMVSLDPGSKTYAILFIEAMSDS